MVIITMQFRSPDPTSDLGHPPHLSHVASLRSQFMETEAFHTLVTEGLYDNGSDSGDGYVMSQARQQSVQGPDPRRVKRKTLHHQAGLDTQLSSLAHCLLSVRNILRNIEY